MTRPRTGYPFLDWGLDQPNAVLAFAHRGGAFHPEIEGLENSLTAFEHAVALGYEYLETDVHATRDGELLAFHDAVLDRVTEDRGAIAELTYDEVSRSLVGGREEIPRMSALLEHFPQVRFNVDLKSDAAVQPLADLLTEMDAHDRICVGSFSDRRMRRFRSLVDGRVATAGTPLEVATLRLLPPTRRLDALADCPAAALQVPYRWGPLRVATRALVERAHRIGKHVHVWTVDDPALMYELLELGVDGLMTDRTDLLRDVLVARGQWCGTQS